MQLVCRPRPNPLPQAGEGANLQRLADTTPLPQAIQGVLFTTPRRSDPSPTQWERDQGEDAVTAEAYFSASLTYVALTATE